MVSNFAGRRGNVFAAFSSTLTIVLTSTYAFAAGDAAQGARNYEDTCKHCHGSPQPGKPGAFSDYDSTANRLSLYASDASAITKAANEGYTIPSGNSNDDYPPGTKTYVPMGSFAGSFGKRLGTGTTPTTYAMDISAYFASLFSAPDEPSINNVVAEDGKASVSFNAPKSDLTITEYTVTANPGGLHASGTASPITVTGLTNGTAYKFTVTATSNAGASKPSSASNAVTPVAAIIVAAPMVAVAAKPVAPVVAAPAAKAAVSKEPVKPATPAANETHSTPSVSPVVSIPVATIPLPVAAPIISVAPVTAKTAETPMVPVTTATIPKEKVETPKPHVLIAPQAAKVKVAAPTSTSSAPPKIKAPMMKFARAGSTDARVFFVLSTDSTPLTSYTVTAFSDGKATGITATGAKSPIRISGLTNGTNYTFTVTANNGKSTSDASDPSNVVTPLGILGN